MRGTGPENPPRIMKSSEEARVCGPPPCSGQSRRNVDVLNDTSARGAVLEAVFDDLGLELEQAKPQILWPQERGRGT
jgi:hypothetical protein